MVITAPSAKFNHPTFLQTLPIVNTCIQWIMRCMSGVLISCSWYHNRLDFGVENDPNGFLFFTQKLPNRFEKFKKHQKRDKISDKVTEGNFRIIFFQFRVNENIPLGSKMTPLSGSRVKYTQMVNKNVVTQKMGSCTLALTPRHKTPFTL